jgi:RNA polymerase sigma-70 factor (ECF subfamily)
MVLAEATAAIDFDRARRDAEERALVAEAKAGSEVAFEKLYRMHVGRVHGLCLRMTANRDRAEDCTQEAFIQAWRALPRFEQRSGFGTWLHRIAVNAVLAQGRRRREETGADAAIDDTLDLIADPATGEAGVDLDIEAAIAALPPGARRVLVLAGVYGYSHEEAASMLGIAVGTCKAQLHRARQLLGARLAPAEQPS